METKWLDSSSQVLDAKQQQIMAEMAPLWDEAEDLWESSKNEKAFGLFVAGDYSTIFRSLVQLRPRARTFLEWGSGLGVVTIMASRLGFEAYGIEHEPVLVALSRRLAEEHGPLARFATGNFIPGEYAWTGRHGDENFRTPFETCEPGYGELGMELEDFDLVYAYPWPDEQELYQDILEQCGHRRALLLSYDAREGLMLSRRMRKR